jgi:hypothetical protein
VFLGLAGDGWLLLPSLISPAIGRRLRRWSEEQAATRAALLTPEMDSSWLGALVEALAWPDAWVRKVARNRLITVLPSAYNSDAERLTPLQIAALYDHLTMVEAATQPDFVIALIHAAARFGHTQAVTRVQSLARMAAFTPTLARVRRTARACLPELEKRAAGLCGVEAEVRSPATAPQITAHAGLSPETRQWLLQVEAEQGNPPAMRPAFLMAAWSIILPYAVYQVVDGCQSGRWLQAGLFAVLAAAATQLHRMTLTLAQARLAERIARIDEPHAIGPLAEIQAWPDARMAREARAALIRLLPGVRPGDAEILNSSQRQALYQRLRLSDARTHPEFLMAILKALEQIGDTEAVPYVQALADSQPASLREQRVCQAAQDCLPYLLSCAQSNRDSQVLLRAAGDAEPIERLLRPIRSNGEPPPDHLLRATAEESG